MSDEQQSVQPVETTEAVEPAVEIAPESDPRTHRFECRSCGYVYDPDEGVKKVGIPAGTAFEDLDPMRFRCPVCRSRVPASQVFTFDCKGSAGSMPWPRGIGCVNARRAPRFSPLKYSELYVVLSCSSPR